MRPIEDFCCQNIDCPDHGIRGKGNLKFQGWSGCKKAIRMILCRTCRTVFSERKGTPLFGSKLPVETALAILDHVREGCGTRSTGRLLEVSKNTVTRYIALAGRHARQLHDELVAFSPSDASGPTRRALELRRQERGPVRPKGPPAGR
jgi:LacI family transcriptional regulator